MDTVPPELVPQILKFLALDDLRRAAAVSRVFYTSAWLSGLCISHRIHWMYGENCDVEVNTLSEIAHHALRKGLRLGLTFTFGPFASRPEGAVSGTPLEYVLSLITAALPILNTLTLTVHDGFVPSLAGALGFAAPNLREVNMAVERTNGPSCPQVPANIFSGAAPKLRHVGLRNLHLGQDTVAAFSRVTSVLLKYHSRNSELDFALHFPAVRLLHLSYFKILTAPPPVSYSLDGLGLQRLAVDEYDPLMLIPAILRSSKLTDIPIVKYTGNNMRCDEPIWHNTDDGPFRILLAGSLTGSSRYYEPARVIVAQQNRRWQREFTLHDWRLNSHCPIAAVPRLAERLSHLRMRNIYVVGFLECSGISLDALRELRIDFHADRPYTAMLWPPDWMNSLGDWTLSFGSDDESASTFARESYSVVACRALETIVLAAVSTAAVSVESREAAFFARALSQCVRPKEERVVLDLVGVELKEPLAHTLLDETFSAVRGAGTESPPGSDDCFWDDDA